MYTSQRYVAELRRRQLINSHVNEMNVVERLHPRHHCVSFSPLRYQFFVLRFFACSMFNVAYYLFRLLSRRPEAGDIVASSFVRSSDNFVAGDLIVEPICIVSFRL